MTATLRDDLAALRALSAELMDLERIGELLSWDQETMMPPHGAPYRAAQRATLDGLAHQRLTAPAVKELLDRLAGPASDPQSPLSEVERALVREMRRDYERAAKLPEALVRDLARATSEGVETWRRARQQARWPVFAGDLERIVALKRREAELLGYTDTPYDALLDLYEPGVTTRALVPLFEHLRTETVRLLDRLKQAREQPDRSVLEQPYDSRLQWTFIETVLRTIGFNFEAGRLDRSTHPFATSLGPGDVRLTTRLHERDLSVGLFGAIHEAGHGLYEQGIDPELARTTLGRAASLGIHESQSRLWENFIGRSLPFWQYFLPPLRDLFPIQLYERRLVEFVRAINVVRPSLIRVEADEVTYNLHIILRFDIERRLIEGQVQVRDLPDLWNALMQEYLGLVPPNDRDGVLQDIHWALGLFGYFPTYTLGNIYAAQLWTALRRTYPDLDSRLAAGEFGLVLGWLREHIHRYGRLYWPVDLIQRATGEAPTPVYLVRYLNEKFGSLYGLAPVGAA